MIYLGQLISLENRTEKEINRRINLPWKKFWSLRHIFKGNFQNYQKGEIFNKCVAPVLTYGSPNWSLTSKLSKKIEITQNSMMRSILGMKRKDHISLKTIKNKLPNVKNCVKTIRNLKWGWAEHIVRLSHNRWTHQATFWFPDHKKRKKGKPKSRWRDEIDQYLKHRRIQQIAKNRKEWEK